MLRNEKKNTRVTVRLAGIVFLFVVIVLGGCTTAGKAEGVNDLETDSLRFDPHQYREGTIVVDGKSIHYRAYEGITYAAKPAVTNYPAWQQMNIYVPEPAYNDQKAPIFFKTDIGGYRPADPRHIDTPAQGGGTSVMQRALAEGMVVVSPGSRGWTSREFYIPGENPWAPPKEVSGEYIGKAPAAIVDLKAAVRYLRYNDAVMPGDAEKIISDGTSAGGALSALLGASGNNPLYKPYLEAIGAADARDDIFAAICFCPITDLEHADMSYEWLYSPLNQIRKKSRAWGGPADPAGLPFLNDDEKSLSAELAVLFPAYLGSLGLKKIDGTPLSAAAAAAGGGVYLDYIKEFVIASGQEAFNTAPDKAGFRAAFPWLIFNAASTSITDIDVTAYLTYVMSKQVLKSVPSFDSMGVLGGTVSAENGLFGTSDLDANNFTEFSWKNNPANQGELPPEIKERVYLMNAMNFIGAPNSATVKNWYIRHGTIDRDTAFTVSVNLYTMLRNRGFDANYKLAWEQPHTGDYDLDNLFAWIKGILGE
jgi:hypothetical protein